LASLTHRTAVLLCDAEQVGEDDGWQVRSVEVLEAVQRVDRHCPTRTSTSSWLTAGMLVSFSFRPSGEPYL
jgi:hypothetical protein